MCILGGGFGGLYTALRLDSLTWPDDKKPQVTIEAQHVTFKQMSVSKFCIDYYRLICIIKYRLLLLLLLVFMFLYIVAKLL